MRPLIRVHSLLVPEPGSPQALNQYAYVYNNALRYLDNEGRIPGGAVPPR